MENHQPYRMVTFLIPTVLSLIRTWPSPVSQDSHFRVRQTSHVRTRVGRGDHSVLVSLVKFGPISQAKSLCENYVNFTYNLVFKWISHENTMQNSCEMRLAWISNMVILPVLLFHALKVFQVKNQTLIIPHATSCGGYNVFDPSVSQSVSQ